MVVDIRLYKRYDADLVALADAGCSISAMMYDAVISYANGTPIHFLIDEITPFDANDRKPVHIKFTIPESQTNAIYMMKNIKKRCKNSFCKALLRNALIQQNLSGYFSDESLLQLQAINLRNENINAMQNVYLCSAYKNARKVIFAGKTFTRQTPLPAITLQPAPLQYTPVTTPQPYPISAGSSVPTFSSPGISPVGFVPPVQSDYTPFKLPQSAIPVNGAIAVPYPTDELKTGEYDALSNQTDIIKPEAVDTLHKVAETSIILPNESHNNTTSATTASDDAVQAETIGFADDDDLFNAFENL